MNKITLSIPKIKEWFTPFLYEIHGQYADADEKFCLPSSETGDRITAAKR